MLIQHLIEQSTLIEAMELRSTQQLGIMIDLHTGGALRGMSHDQLC